jgi:hypothetical protein
VRGPIQDSQVTPAAATDSPLVPVPAGTAQLMQAPMTDSPPAIAPAVSSIAQDAPPPGASKAAADLLATSLVAGQETGLYDRPLTLLEAIARHRDRREQLSVARAYWKLSSAFSRYHWTVQESKALEQVAVGNAAADAPLLATARAAATARMHELRIELVVAQHELADRLAFTSSDPLPFPADQPLVGPYRTYFDTLFAARSAASFLRAIHRALPMRREAIDARAAAVQAAASAVHSIEESHARGESDMRNFLACHEQLHAQRTAFIAQVYEYNDDIAEYALAVADPAASDAQLVAMMIRTRPTGTLSSVNPLPTGAPRIPTGAPRSVQPAGSVEKGWVPVTRDSRP